MAMDISFYGDSFSKEEHELRIMRIDPLHRDGEADLFRTRWFDYALMHPVRATYLYAHHYQEQTRIFCETCIDLESAQDARGFFPKDIFMSRDMTGMWLARRACDALGCPYDWALRFAQHRAINRLHRTMPRPNQLYGEEFIIDLTAAWKENLATSLRYSRSDAFKVAAWKGSWVQRQHLAFVLGQVKRRAPESQVNLMGRLMYEGVVSAGLLKNHFSEEAIGRAQSIAVNLDAQSALT